MDTNVFTTTLNVKHTIADESLPRKSVTDITIFYQFFATIDLTMMLD